MPKYYVIPIDNEGLGYFGIKEGFSPYTHERWFCGGCPQAFGGNDQGGIFETLYNETLEESHTKIYLVRGVRYYRKVHEAHGMSYFVCTKFTYHPQNSIPQVLRAHQKKYWETTGEVLRADMDLVPTSNRADAATQLLQTLYTRTGRRPHPKSINDFLVSETAEAIRSASALIRAGRLPTFV